jgi:hypothetical protein
LYRYIEDETVTQEGAELANSRFKTAKEDVMGVYDKWAEAYGGGLYTLNAVGPIA